MVANKTTGNTRDDLFRHVGRCVALSDFRAGRGVLAVGRRAEFIGVAYSRLGTAAGAYAGGCGLLLLRAGRRRARLGSYFSRAQFGLAGI